MFNLTLHDHLNLTFTEITERLTVHTAKAQSHARWGRRLRGGEAVLIGGVCIAAAGAAFGHGQILSIVAASLAGVALFVLLVSLTFDFDASSRAHATHIHHLWGVRERYRSLLSDLHDGAVSLGEARLRRDRLITELRAIYEATPLAALETDLAQPPEASEPPAPRPHPAATASPPNTLGFSPKVPTG